MRHNLTKHRSRHKTEGMQWYVLPTQWVGSGGGSVYWLCDFFDNAQARTDVKVRECGGLGGFVLETKYMDDEPEVSFFWKRSHAEAAGFRWQMQRRVEYHRMLAERALEVAT